MSCCVELTLCREWKRHWDHARIICGGLAVQLQLESDESHLTMLLCGTRVASRITVVKLQHGFPLAVAVVVTHLSFTTAKLKPVIAAVSMPSPSFSCQEGAPPSKHNLWQPL